MRDPQVSGSFRAVIEALGMDPAATCADRLILRLQPSGANHRGRRMRDLPAHRSGAHLHASRPNRTGRTRLNMDTGIVDRDDALAGRGPANVDGRAPRVVHEWFRTIASGERLSPTPSAPGSWCAAPTAPTTTTSAYGKIKARNRLP